MFHTLLAVRASIISSFQTSGSFPSSQGSMVEKRSVGCEFVEKFAVTSENRFPPRLLQHSVRKRRGPGRGRAEASAGDRAEHIGQLFNYWLLDAIRRFFLFSVRASFLPLNFSLLFRSMSSSSSCRRHSFRSPKSSADHTECPSSAPLSKKSDRYFRRTPY